MSKSYSFINGILTNVSNTSASPIGARKFNFTNGILTSVSDVMPGLSRNSGSFVFVNGLLTYSSISGSSGSITPPPPPPPSGSPIWLAGGIDPTNALAYSYDGINWVGEGRTLGVAGICWNGSRFVVAGGDGSTHQLAYSADGINWSLVSESNSWGCVAWNGTRFIVGGGGSFFSPEHTFGDSLDGITWHIQSVTIIGVVTTIAWNGSMFVAGGFHTGQLINRHNTLAYSSTGLSWTGLGESVFTEWCYNIATNGTIWVGVGQGDNSIAYSYNGIDWIGLGNSIFSNYGTGICWDGTKFVAAGDGDTNTIAYSYNGIDWTGLGNPLFSVIGSSPRGGQCVSWNGNMFMIGGNVNPMGDSTNTLGYSYDGFTWYPLGTSVFAYQTSCITPNHSPNLIPPV